MKARLTTIIARLRQIDWRDVRGLTEDEASAWRCAMDRLERAEVALGDGRLGDAHDLLFLAVPDLVRCPDLGDEIDAIEDLREDVSDGVDLIDPMAQKAVAS